MKELYKNEFEDVYTADVGKIVKIKDSNSKYNNKLIYEFESTFNGYCYKDYNNFKNNPNEVCYISEALFDDDLFVDYVKNNKEKLIKEGGLSTANSIKEELKNFLIREEYYYEYQKNNVVYTIEAKNFDEDLINYMALLVFDIVDWQTTQGYIYEHDWTEQIEDYYNNKYFEKGVEL